MKSFKEMADIEIKKIESKKEKNEIYMEEIIKRVGEVKCPICNSDYKLEYIKTYGTGKLMCTCYNCTSKGFENYASVTIYLNRSWYKKIWKIIDVEIESKKKKKIVEGKKIKFDERELPKLTDNEIKEIMKRVKTDFKCELCNSDDNKWLVSHYMYSISTFDYKLTDSHLLPLVNLICNNCGNLKLLSAGVVGITKIEDNDVKRPFYKEESNE